MKRHRTLSRFRSFIKRLLCKLSRCGSKTKVRVEERELLEAQSSLQTIAYNLIGEKINYVLPIFEDLDANLQKSGTKVSFKIYVSISALATLLLSTALLTAVPCLLIFVFGIPLFPAILFGIGGALFAAASTLIVFYIYPVYRADKLRRDLEDELPFTTGYMAILAGAGVSPERVLGSISSLSIPLAVSAEAKNVMRSINLFGSDIISALEDVARRSPSKSFRDMLEGYISTIHSGSDSVAYLNNKSRQYMKLKRINLKKFSDTLSILSEFYVALLLTGPLLLVIMLTVMAMLGGSNLGIFSPGLLLGLLTYIAIPIGAVIFLIVLDALTPRW